MVLNTLDPFHLKQQFDRFNAARDLADELTADLDFVRSARRVLLPLPFVDRPRPLPTKIFPPLRKRPIPYFKNKKVGLVLSGGSGSCVAACGVMRALEEAEIEPAAISVCSASSLWGSMIAAGLTAQEMVDFTLSWRPEEYLDIQWIKLPKFAFQAMRGFTGMAKAEAVEHLYDRRLWHMTVGETDMPIYSIVYNLDIGRIEYFGSKLTPEITIGELVRTAIALPLFMEAVRLDGHFYVDGGIIDAFPTEPLERYEKIDAYLGVNVLLPPGFEGEDISGWDDKRMGFLEASRQLRYAQHIELARRSKERLGKRLILLEPVSHRQLYGVRFYDLFLNRAKWPSLIRAGYDHTKEVLNAYRPKRRGQRPASKRRGQRPASKRRGQRPASKHARA